ncbi:hypothetical protein [Demequina subtropica]|uniref:hypothetical protein n=1 Tax=Demequina subtropica TaxID=1638989 RepID=UPI00078137F7|nr:hypothetical protein [Demequina subtropica]
MTTADAPTDARRQEWARRLAVSTLPARLEQAMRPFLADGATAVAVSGALALRRVQLVVEVHHPAGEIAGPWGPMTRLPASQEIEELVAGLRRSSCSRQMGTWLRLHAWLVPGGTVEIHVDDSSEPSELDPPLSDLEWQMEWFLNRREADHIPPWWRAKLGSEALAG